MIQGLSEAGGDLLQPASQALEPPDSTANPVELRLQRADLGFHIVSLTL